MTSDNWQSNNTFCELTHKGLISISGEEARTFLQGQVTNDVNQLSDNTAHLSAYCSPKGRMLAMLTAFAHNDTIYLQLDSSVSEAVAKRLRMYLLRAKAKLEDVSAEWVAIGINGPNAAQLCSELFGEVPTADFGITPIKRGALMQLPALHGQQRFQAFVQTVDATEIMSNLKANCTQIDTAQWDWFDIQAGIPEVYSTTQDQFVPQMLNLDVLNGINFKKGCYTGQEVVARTHYLGSVKRRTYLAHIDTEGTPAVGDKVVNAEGLDAGQIVRLAPDVSGGYDALIQMRIKAQSDTVLWQEAAVRFKDLPYSLEAASN